ncbi:MAG: hypothetical protein OZSIB_2067 [Candidatus Ozemobacter sibiricus]|jgi:hypothetical protein|uniref:DUF1116 domain-containing protein n=1 Tax=Candidatus Ozemobacter sibiricus TaxID=2268124 RepID=A0A367ZST7_9BACT|nr:MAG: hypothetical protein OZSIB_2067 [Candidatus Ozemobacter sibiricus]
MKPLDIAAINREAVQAIQKVQPELVGIGIAGEVVPRLRRNLVLHAGPPITWDRMCGPLRGAVMGALVYEGLARSIPEAERLAASGEIAFEPWHEHDGVGPMAGVATASMPVWIVEDRASGRRTFCTLNEGLGKVLRYGAYSEEVLTRLRWMRDVLGPVLQEALTRRPPINLKALIAQALQMGDEVHNRHRAATSLLFRELAPAILRTRAPTDDQVKVLEFLHANDHTFLNLSMPAAKLMLQAAEWREGCTLVTTMARNGTDFGIRVAGLPHRWFTGPAGQVKGLLFPGFIEADCNPDIGDSAITETVGLGGFSMAAAPAIVKFVGGTVADAMRYTQTMYEITVGESEAFQIPSLDFRGAPLGIDLLKVCETGILPQINTGIAHREAGVGQVGAGLVNPPRQCFEAALAAFVEIYCPE